jgi:hypothetical protein
MNPLPQFLFVAQSTANLKPEEACVRIHKSWRNSAIAYLAAMQMNLRARRASD